MIDLFSECFQPNKFNTIAQSYKRKKETKNLSLCDISKMIQLHNFRIIFKKITETDNISEVI